MSTNEKTANEIIEELEAEKAELLKNLEAANDLIEADTEMHAKDVEKSIELIKLAKENKRLRAENERMRDLICAWWRNAITPTWDMRKKDIKDTIEIVAEKNKELKK